MTQFSSFDPVVILGAGRSGTNMLRDSLTSLAGVGTWPCDEIGYIWRHHNARFPTDEIPPDRATPRVRRYIRGQFSRLADEQGLQVVVEKTCANTLRVPFIAAVLPEARFVHIIRDGRDVAVSAAERWTAKLDIPYLMRKARYVPPTDLPYYGARYFWNRIARFTNPEKRLSAWGPRFTGMVDVLRTKSLLSACAIQWEVCAKAAARDLKALELPSLTVHYEDFVSEPVREFTQIVEFLGIDATEAQIERAVSSVSARSVGRWRKKLAPEDHRSLNAEIGGSLSQFGYEVDG